MEKSLLIVGAGPGISLSVAKKFGTQGFQIGLISRNANNLQTYVEELAKEKIKAFFETADAWNEKELATAILALKSKLGSVDVLVYNAANLKQKDILDETAASLQQDFIINVANALTSVKLVLDDLKETNGAAILTGGGFSLFPSAPYGSISLGKASIRSLAFQLNEALAEENVFVGTITIKGFVDENSQTLNVGFIAEQFYKLYEERSTIEIQL